MSEDIYSVLMTTKYLQQLILTFCKLANKNLIKFIYEKA